MSSGHSYDGDVIRNLLYFVWPTKHTDVWQWNIKQLLRRMDQFNGQRIVSVATDQATVAFETVQKAFKGTVTHFIHYQNNPALGEMVAFPEMMRRVENIDPRQITFYGHAKGVKYKPGAQPMVRRWAAVMYKNLLDYPTLVNDSLQSHPIVGTFLKTGNAFGTLPPAWHFAGTYFWFRNNMVFDKPLWNRTALQWWGVEAWPGVIIPEKEADCLFYKGSAPSLMLYAKGTWKDTINPLWKEWQIKHSKLHSFCSYREVLNSINCKRIVVSGPQRSGTTIASKMISSDLKLPRIDEIDFGVHNYEAFKKIVDTKKEFVIHAPTMSAYLHNLSNCAVVWMRRNVQDILRSQKRINWSAEDEEKERDRYFDHTKEPIAVVKTRAWEQFQRVALEEMAWDLDYHSLTKHPLWIDKDKRRSFGPRQTKLNPSL